MPLSLTSEMASVAERRARAPAERQAPECAMSQVLIAIVDDDEPCAMRRNRSCDLWATTFPRLAQPMNFSTPSKSRTSCLITDLHMPGLERP